MEHKLFQNRASQNGFTFKDGESAIVPVMLHDAKLAQTFASQSCSKEDIYVIDYYFPGCYPKVRRELVSHFSAAHQRNSP